MSVFKVWFRKTNDGRAPEVVFLDLDEAASLKDMAAKLSRFKEGESPLSQSRALRVGDVAVNQISKIAYIFTPSTIWSIVTPVESPLEPLAADS
jgi:uncharacterized protein YqfA (UPF0365 family)